MLVALKADISTSESISRPLVWVRKGIDKTNTTTAAVMHKDVHGAYEDSGDPGSGEDVPCIKLERGVALIQ